MQGRLGCSKIACRRNLLVFPRGNNRMASNISVYLNVPDSDMPNGWQRRTRFKLIIVNKKPTKHIVRGVLPQHTCAQDPPLDEKHAALQTLRGALDWHTYNANF